MVDYKRYVIGAIILLISTGIIYITFNEQARMRVDNDKTTFYIKQIDQAGEPYGRWLVSGREYNKLFDGTSLIRRHAKDIQIEQVMLEGNTTKITRTTPYFNGAVIKDTYLFDGDIDDIKLFPISHKVEIFNGSTCGIRGCIYQYEVRDLIDDPLEGIRDGVAYAGYNMMIEWDYSNYYERYFELQNKDKLVIKYRIHEDYESFNVRLFDPTFYGENDLLLVWGHTTNNFPDYSNGSTANSWTAKQPLAFSGADVSNIFLIQNPTKEEMLIVWIDVVEDIHVQLWDGTTFYGYQELETGGHNSDRFQSVHGTVETLSGDYFVAFARGDAEFDDFLWYTTYDQDTQTWAAVTKFADDGGNQVENVITVAHPATDEILVLSTDSGDFANAWIWDGDTETNFVQITDDLEDGSIGDPSTNTPEVPISGAWHNNTDEAVVIWSEELVQIKTRVWNGAGWDAEVVQSALSSPDIQYIMLKSSIWENKIRGGTFDDDNDVHIFELNSSLDVISLTEVEVTAFSNEPYKSVDVVMTAAGRFIYSWNDASNIQYLNDSYEVANIVVVAVNNPAQVVGSYLEDMAMFSVIDNTLGLGVFMVNMTTGATTFTDNIENSMENSWSMDIQPNVFFGALPPAPPDTCTCAGNGNDWEIDHSDGCIISVECLLGTGTLSFIGTGETKCDAHVTTTNLGEPGSGGQLSILDDCYIEVN